ncbi:MAG: alkaline phosphatase family protein [Rhodospirillales bacterium]
MHGFRIAALTAASLVASRGLVPSALARSAPPITHVIMIMEENRSFDHYFGTYPGANGYPNGTCVPLDPTNPQKGCVAPFHDPHDVSAGGPHGNNSAVSDIDGTGANPPFDGFVYQQSTGGGTLCSERVLPVHGPKTCKGVYPGILRHDVMGYHDAGEIPNYWAYAQHFVLQDELFESVRGASAAAHIDLTSEWVATCTSPTKVSTCTTSLNPKHVTGTNVLYPWGQSVPAHGSARGQLEILSRHRRGAGLRR